MGLLGDILQVPGAIIGAVEDKIAETLDDIFVR